MSAYGFSRGTDNPLGGVVEDAAPRVWRVGDVVEGADYDALPVGTTVWQWGGAPGEEGHVADCFWTKATADTWHGWDGFRLGRSSKRVIRSLPVAPAAPAGDGLCTLKHPWAGDVWCARMAGHEGQCSTKADPASPAPAERQPCAAWVQDGSVTWAWVLGSYHSVVYTGDNGTTWHVSVRGKFLCNVTGGRAAAQLAAEDALEADAREVLALLGKGCA
jgi:hypothetical protein